MEQEQKTEQTPIENNNENDAQKVAEMSESIAGKMEETSNIEEKSEKQHSDTGKDEENTQNVSKEEETASNQNAEKKDEIEDTNSTEENAKEVDADSTEEKDEKNAEEKNVEEKDSVDETKDDHSDDIFITENDTFDVKIRWYKIGGNLYIEGDEDEDEDSFDNDRDDINEFVVTFKYPSQGDYEAIMGSKSFRSTDQMAISDIVQLEIARLVTLVRRWNLKQDLTRMVELDPSIVKAMMEGVRKEIGMKGIL